MNLSKRTRRAKTFQVQTICHKFQFINVLRIYLDFSRDSSDVGLSRRRGNCRRNDFDEVERSAVASHHLLLDPRFTSYKAIGAGREAVQIPAPVLPLKK